MTSAKHRDINKMEIILNNVFILNLSLLLGFTNTRLQDIAANTIAIDTLTM